MSGRQSEAETVMKNLEIRVAFSAIDRLTQPVNTARRSAGALSESLSKTQTRIKSLGKETDSFRRLSQSLEQTDRSINRVKRRFDGLAESQRTGNTLTEKQQTLMTKLGERLDKLNAKRTTEITRLREVSQGLRQHGVVLSGSSGTIASATRRTEQYTAQLERERRALATTTQAQQRYEKTKQAGARMRSGGAVATGVATAAGYGAGRFLSPGIGFGKEMSRVGALTRIDEKSEAFAGLRQQAKDLGANTAFTTSDAASGQAFLAMAGFTPDAIRAALPGVLDMALAGDVGLGETADIGSNIMTQFGLASGDMGRIGDVLTGTFTRTNTDLRQLGETMTYTGPVAAGLGIELEKAAAMAGVLANSGLRGSMAGTAMRATLSRLASPTKKAQAALDELGISVADAGGKMRPIESILTDLYNKTKKYGETDQVSFFKDIAGEEAFVGLQALVGGAGSGFLQQLIGELKQAKGEAATVAAKMTDNLDGDVMQLRSAWEGFRIQVSESIDGVLRNLTQGLTSIIRGVTNWAKANPRLTQSIALFGGALVAAVGAVGGLSLALGLLAGPFAKLRLGFALLSGPSGIGGMIAGVGRLGTMLPLLSGPVGLIGIALAGAALLVFKYWGPIKAFFSGIFSGIAQGLAPLIGTFSRLSPLFSIIANGVKTVWGWFTKLLTPVNASAETLNKCASAGEIFGRVLSGAINLALTPTRALMGALEWILEKLGVLPDEAERARQKLEDQQRTALLQDKVTLLQGDMAKVAPKPVPKPASGVAAAGSAALTPDNGTMRRLQSIDTNTKTTAENTRTKRIGPGDIVFKNLPRALAVRGEWREPIAASTGAVRPAREMPTIQPAPDKKPVQRVSSTASTASAAGGFTGEIHVHLHGVTPSADIKNMARLVGDAVSAELDRRARSTRGSYRDRE